MPFCPKCRAEYEYGVAKCEDCDAPLVSQLPEAKKDETFNSDNSEVVHLCTVNNETEAVLMCDLLKQAGIEASYRSPWVSRYYIGVTIDQAFTWGEIMVLDKDYDTAKEIVDEYLKDIDNKKTEKKQEE